MSNLSPKEKIKRLSTFLKVDKVNITHINGNIYFKVKVKEGILSTRTLLNLINGYFYPYINKTGLVISVDNQLDDDNKEVFKNE